MARRALVGTALILTAVDLAVKAAVERGLGAGTAGFGGLRVQLGYNAGVSFGFGGGLPGWVVVGGTGLLCLLLFWYAWRTVPATRWPGRVGLAGVLGGALGNLVDRAADGRVTDYLHTGWWPTFNLADVLICVGVGLLVLTVMFGPEDPPRR